MKAIPRMAQAVARLRLQASVLAWRHGVLGPLALVVLVLSAALGGWAVHSQGQREAALRARLLAADDALRKAGSPQKPAAWRQTDPVLELRRVLGGASPEGDRSAVRGAEVIAAVMGRRGLAWTSADYRETMDRPTGLRRLQMQIAVTAPYPQVRDLVEDLLRQMPQASVDALSVVREGAAQPVPTSRLTVSLWSLSARTEGQP